eukprot:211225-Chlamydomonas_euryale.AAC.1
MQPCMLSRPCTRLATLTPVWPALHPCTPTHAAPFKPAPAQPHPYARCAAAAAVVADAGAGGQVLMDDTTFSMVKDRLEELASVDHTGLNDAVLHELRAPWWMYWRYVLMRVRPGGCTDVTCLRVCGRVDVLA